jgi:hypothetical protein
VRTLYLYSGLQQRVIAHYSEFIPRGQSGDIPVRQLDARQRLQKAMDLTAFAHIWRIVWRVCCEDKTPGGEKNTERLRDALDWLADHESEWWDGREDTAID